MGDRTASLYLFTLSLILATHAVAQKPKVTVFSGPTATIQNSEALVTSDKARVKYGLPHAWPLRRETPDVRLGEVVPFEEKSLSPNLGERVRKAVSKIQPCGVTSFPELAERLPRGVCLFDINVDKLDFSRAEKQVSISKTIGSETRFNNDRSLNEGGGRYADGLGGLDGFVELAAIGLI